MSDEGIENKSDISNEKSLGDKMIEWKDSLALKLRTQGYAMDCKINDNQIVIYNPFNNEVLFQIECFEQTPSFLIFNVFRNCYQSSSLMNDFDAVIDFFERRILK